MGSRESVAPLPFTGGITPSAPPDAPLPQAGELTPSAPLPRAGGLTPSAPLPRAGGAGGGQSTTLQPGQFKPRNTIRARDLRNEPTPAERLLWMALRNRKLDGFKFSRQMPVGPYFADFLCREAGLVVELDGASHDTRHEYDAARDRYMAEQSLRVLRIANDDVMRNIEGVCEMLLRELEALPARRPPHPNPSPQGEGLNVEAQKLLGISLEGSVG